MKQNEEFQKRYKFKMCAWFQRDPGSFSQLMRDPIMISSNAADREILSSKQVNPCYLKPAIRPKLAKTHPVQMTVSALASAMEFAPDPVLCLNAKGEVLAYNSAACDMFQLNTYDPNLFHIADFVVEHNFRRAVQSWLKRDVCESQNTKACERRQTFNLRLKRPDAGPFTAEMTLVRALTGDITVFIRDISNFIYELNEKDAAYASLKNKVDLKSRFIAAISHEIRTPFNAVSGLLDILSETDLDDEQRALVMTSQETTTALLQITDDVLDYTKITAGKLLLAQSPFKARDVFSPIIRLFEPMVNNKGLKLSLDVDEVEDLTLIGDVPRLRQILMNFVSNAIKFTDVGHITLWAGTRTLPSGMSELTCVVKDTGIGISMDMQSHLFGEFYRVEDGQTQRHAGTGLGLAISKILVRMMDGLIGVNSGTEQGSNFWVSVPFKVGNAADSAANCAIRVHSVSQNRMKSMGQNENLTGVKILLADDNKTNQMILTRHLEKMGAHVTVVENGVEALQVLEAAPFDIAFMDISMPVMDGITATHHIRALDGPRATLPILALTALASPDIRIQCLEAGMFAVLTKPIDCAELQQVILETIGPAKKDNHTFNTDLKTRAVFERSVLDSIFTGLAGPDIFALSAQVSKDLSTCIEDLEQAVTARNIAAIQRLSHILKGLSATFGCLNLSEIAELTNYNAINGSVDAAVHDGHQCIVIGRDAINQVDQVFTTYAKIA